MGYSAVDKILTLQEEELKFMENIRNCINMRIKCDRDYASSLLVVSVCAQKCHLSDDIGKTSIGKAWMSIASQMQELSKLVNASAEELTHEVLELMDELVSEKKALRKALIEEYNKYSNKLENLMKSVQKIQTEYQKCLMSYKCTKTKYEDIYLRLPKKTDNSTLNGKIQKRFDETKRRYKKLCQKLHLLHNDYCLITIEAKQYEKDLRLLLIPSLISFNDVLLMDSGEKWNNILIKYVEKTDLTQDKYRKLQNQLRNSVENIIKSNIYGDLRGKLAKPQLPQLTINFNDKLLEDFIGALKPNQLVIDTFTIDSLKVRESQLQKMLIESQKDIREKSRLIKNYEQEIQSLSSLINDNSKAQIGITTRKRALDIIKKDLVYAESEHERTHRLWEEVDVCLNKIAGIQVPNGLELNLSEPEPEVDMRPTSSLSCGADTSESARSISTMSYTMSWGRSIMKKLKLQKSPKMTSSSVSTRSYPSSMSRCSSEKRQERDTNGLDLNDEEWFHGSLPRTESNRLLKKKGDFLVRQTVQNNERCIVVSVFWNGFRHFIVNTDSAGRYKFEGPSFTTISDLIDYYQYNKTAITQKSGALLLNAIPRESWELNNDDIELKEKIGRGNFGDVYKGILKKTGTGTLKEMLVAIKTCKINLPDEQKRKFLAEGRILKQYNHPNIVQLIGICVHKQPVMIVMELVEGGALINYLRSNINRVKLDLLALMRMCIDAASGMEYLESKNCIHRDLAARNCLIGLDKTVKISDFGMSREANIQLEYTVSDGMKQIPIKWTAPEALNYGRYTSLCDVWSFGILMWEVFTLGSAPYSGMSNTKARELIDNGYRLPCPPKTPENVYQIMHKCWKYEPENRPHFKQIRQFLEDIYFEIKKLDIKAKSLQNSDIEIHL